MHPATQVARNLCTNSLRQECLCVLYVLVTVAHVGSILHILTLRHLIPAIPLVYFGISTNFLGKFCNAVLCPECCLRGEEVARGENAFSRTPRSVMKFFFSNDLNAKEFLAFELIAIALRTI